MLKKAKSRRSFYYHTRKLDSTSVLFSINLKFIYMKAELDLTVFDIEELKEIADNIEEGEVENGVLEKYIETKQGYEIYLKINVNNQ